MSVPNLVNDVNKTCLPSSSWNIVLLSHMAYKLSQLYITFIPNIKSSHLGLYAPVITCWLSTYYVPNPVLGTGGTTVSKTHRCLTPRNVQDKGGGDKFNNRLNKIDSDKKETDTTEWSTREMIKPWTWPFSDQQN